MCQGGSNLKMIKNKARDVNRDMGRANTGHSNDPEGGSDGNSNRKPKGPFSLGATLTGLGELH